jgi:hypothetical protein
MTEGTRAADEVAHRLSELEQRIVHLEDTVEVLRVVAGYGPSVDGGAATEAGMLWTDDCEYDSDNAPEPLRGRAAIEQLSTTVGAVPMGVAHFHNLPIVVVDGDRATVTGHSNTFHQEGDRYAVARVSANRWELERVDRRWQIRRRVNRILDGSPEGRALLAEGSRDVEADRRQRAGQHPS